MHEADSEPVLSFNTNPKIFTVCVKTSAFLFGIHCLQAAPAVSLILPDIALAFLQLKASHLHIVTKRYADFFLIKRH